MVFEHKDKFGRQVERGSVVLYAKPRCRTAEMYFGIITKLTPSGYVGYLQDIDYISKSGQVRETHFNNTRVGKPENIIVLNDQAVVAMGLADIITELKLGLDAEGDTVQQIKVTSVVPV